MTTRASGGVQDLRHSSIEFPRPIKSRTGYCINLWRGFMRVSLCSTHPARAGGWLPPREYRNKEASNQANYLDAHSNSVPDRRGISMNSAMRAPVWD
jgi:hypothetical protein